jgi:hypothetical protein
MTAEANLARAEHAKVRNHIHALRTNLTRARDSLLHFKQDRFDRDKLEPAARRVDDLMNMFAGELRDLTEGAVWVAEIESTVAGVTNPKVTDALRAARIELTALLDILRPGGR